MTDSFDFFNAQKEDYERRDRQAREKGPEPSSPPKKGPAYRRGPYKRSNQSAATPVVDEETKEEVAEAVENAEPDEIDDGEEYDGEPIVTVHRGTGGRQLLAKTVERRPPQRPPNYRLHVVAALSISIVITFLAGGKDIISAIKKQ